MRILTLIKIQIYLLFFCSSLFSESFSQVKDYIICKKKNKTSCEKEKSALSILVRNTHSNQNHESGMPLSAFIMRHIIKNKDLFNRRLLFEHADYLFNKNPHEVNYATRFAPRNNKGQIRFVSMLGFAAYNDDLEAVEFLLKKGADPIYAPGRILPISLALENGNEDMLDILYDAMMENFPDDMQLIMNYPRVPLLEVALRKRHYHLIDWLFEKGVNNCQIKKYRVCKTDEIYSHNSIIDYILHKSNDKALKKAVLKNLDIALHKKLKKVEKYKKEIPEEINKVAKSLTSFFDLDEWLEKNNLIFKESYGDYEKAFIALMYLSLSQGSLREELMGAVEVKEKKEDFEAKFSSYKTRKEESEDLLNELKNDPRRTLIRTILEKKSRRYDDNMATPLFEFAKDYGLVDIFHSSKDLREYINRLYSTDVEVDLSLSTLKKYLLSTRFNPYAHAIATYDQIISTIKERQIEKKLFRLRNYYKKNIYEQLKNSEKITRTNYYTIDQNNKCKRILLLKSSKIEEVQLQIDFIKNLLENETHRNVFSDIKQAIRHPEQVILKRKFSLIEKGKSYSEAEERVFTLEYDEKDIKNIRNIFLHNEIDELKTDFSDEEIKVFKKIFIGSYKVSLFSELYKNIIYLHEEYQKIIRKKQHEARQNLVGQLIKTGNFDVHSVLETIGSRRGYFDAMSFLLKDIYTVIDEQTKEEFDDRALFNVLKKYNSKKDYLLKRRRFSINKKNLELFKRLGMLDEVPEKYRGSRYFELIIDEILNGNESFWLEFANIETFLKAARQKKNNIFAYFLAHKKVQFFENIMRSFLYRSIQNYARLIKQVPEGRIALLYRNKDEEEPGYDKSLKSISNSSSQEEEDMPLENEIHIKKMKEREVYNYTGRILVNGGSKEATIYINKQTLKNLEEILKGKFDGEVSTRDLIFEKNAKENAISTIAMVFKNISHIDWKKHKQKIKSLFQEYAT